MNHRTEKIVTQAIRVKEKDNSNEVRCQYFYGSKISESNLISKIGIMKVNLFWNIFMFIERKIFDVYLAKIFGHCVGPKNIVKLAIIGHF